MKWLETLVRSVAGSSPPAGPAQTAARLLDAYGRLPFRSGSRVSQTPEGRAILESEPDVQVAIVIEALRRARAIGPGATERWEERWALQEAAKALLRRRQPFGEEHVRTLVGFLVDQIDTYWSLFPTLDVLRALAAHAERHPLPEDLRQSLEQVRVHVLVTMRGGDQRKAAVVLDELLGPVRETAPAQEPETVPPEEEQAALLADARKRIQRFRKDVDALPAKRGSDWHASWREVDPADAPSAPSLLQTPGPALGALLEASYQEYVAQLSHFGGSYAQDYWGGALAWLIEQLAGRAAELPPWQIERLLRVLASHEHTWLNASSARPLLLPLLGQVETRRLVPRLREPLTALRTAGTPYAGHYGVRELLLLLDAALQEGRPVYVEAVDTWGSAARQSLDAMPEAERATWTALLAHARAASGARPSAAWLKRAAPLIEAVGKERFTRQVAEWLGFLRRPPSAQETELAGPYSPLALTDTNATILKGLVWAAAHVPLVPLAAALAVGAPQAFKKIPGAGPRAIGVGNACIHALAQVGGMEGVQRLQWLRHRVTYIPAVKLIDSSLQAAAGKLGVDRQTLEELLAPSYGLSEGKRTETFGQYVAELALDAREGATIRWSRADGAALKSEPAAARKEFGEEIKALKADAEEIRRMLPVQRARVERLLLEDRSWSLRDWRERYLDHGFMSHVARRLIWWFAPGGGETEASVPPGGGARAGIWLDGQLVDATGQPLRHVPDHTSVRLWHPIGVAPEEVLAWRTFLERHEIVQPFKQAHREVYLLTDAELQTRTYSNRFAAHILRQHQMHALAQGRGWKAPLALVYDGAWDVTLSLELPRWRVRAEFYATCALEDDNLEAGYNDNGVCLYVATDQVRFSRIAPAGTPLDGEPLPLVDVPALVFTEVMRDVDLFVGVASVGNDPTWRDRGPAGQRVYWERYAFGDLGETAKTRRAALERLLPRLTALAGRWTLGDRFLVIRGHLKTYKIHLGSGNILMEPNDQYLCIVPGRKKASAGGPNDSGDVFLPFEGDDMLSLILSKAFLLAADDKITDPTITHQIGRAR